jgi:pilus assembly protein Flp/PilA
MRDSILKYFVRARAFRDFLSEESGQDLVEYAVVVGLIAMGSVAAMQGLATTIGNALASVGTKVTTYTS